MPLILPFFTLAETDMRDLVGALRDRLTGLWDKAAIMAIVLALVMVCGLILFHYFIVPALERRKTERTLWSRLIEAHKLTRAEEAVLRNLVSTLRLSNPCTIFVKKSIFDREIAAGRASNRLSELRAKLF
jgi:hypothetical protein